MRFMLRCAVPDLDGLQGSTLSLPLAGRHSIEVRLCIGSTDDDELGYVQWMELECEGEWRPSKSVLRFFSSLEVGANPPGLIGKVAWVSREFDEYGHMHQWTRLDATPGAFPHTDSLPAAVRNIGDEARSVLTAEAIRVVDAIRWRYAIEGGHDPLRNAELFWRVNKQDWRHYPRPGNLWFRFRSFPELGETLGNEVASALDPPSEPMIAWSIWREANEQIDTNPRSALVIGVAAAEAGVKQWLASEMNSPGSWIVENLQAPPVSRILRQFAPLVLAQKPDVPFSKIPAQEIIAPLEKAIEARNVLVHSSPTGNKLKGLKVQLEKDQLEETLNAIGDLLWLLEYFRGHAWAADHLRKPTREVIFGDSN